MNNADQENSQSSTFILCENSAIIIVGDEIDFESTVNNHVCFNIVPQYGR